MTEVAQVDVGDEVECIVTGLKGFAMAVTESLHGCRRVDVQPPVDLEKDKNKIPDGICVDEPQCRIITKGARVPPVLPKETYVVALGDEVKDPVTGFEGTIVGWAKHFNGCDLASVQPKLNEKDGKWRDNKWFSAARLVLLRSKPVVEEKVEKPAEPARPRSGGPMTKMERYY